MRSKLSFVGIAATLLFAIAAIGARPSKDARQVDEDPHFKVLGKAGIPHQINYQGYLTDNAGNATTDTLEMTFSIWDAASGGNQLWSETQPSVPVIDGLFNVLLGSVTNIPSSVFSNPISWLQTEIDGQILSPRKEIVSVGYVFRAGVADTASYAAIATYARNADTAAYSSYADSAGTVGPVAYADSARVTGSAVYADSAGVTGYAHDADMVDGQHASDFLSTANDWGRSGVATDLYEGTTTLSDKYVNEKDLDHLDAADGEPINAVYVDDKGNVGIGTMEPEGKLEVVGKIKGQSLGIGVHGSGVICGVFGEGIDGVYGKGRIAIHGEANYEVSENAIAGFFDGNVGIGTMEPETRLHVKHHDEHGKPSLILENSHPTAHARISFRPHSVEQAYIYANVNGATVFNTNGGGMYFRSYGEDNMIIKDNGNVGIGATEPETKLHVKHFDEPGIPSLILENSRPASHARISFRPNSVEQAYIYANVNGAAVFNTSGGGLYFRSNEVDKMIIRDNGTVECAVLKLTGGSDIAEPFDIEESEKIQPGIVLVIDPDNPGKLKVSEKAYDRCVAGIVSGAGGIKPGLTMMQEGSFEGDHNVALAGRVYGLCDASYGSIEPGDLLTTSPTPGYAMKVTDHERAQGAILGKAMTKLEEGQGLVLVLVTLQ